MTSLDKHSFNVQSLGKQSQSNRLSAPVYGISKVGREQFAKVYISEAHTRTAEIGRHGAGPDYEVKSSLNLQTGGGFAKGPRDMMSLKKTSMKNKPGEFAFNPDDPDDIPTNDALGANVDSQPFKYRRETEIIIGTEPRGRLKDAELMKNHSAAFFGRESPGPAAIDPPDMNVCRERIVFSRPFGGKYKNPAGDYLKFGDNPANIGPGAHDRKDVAIGQQYLSKRRNQNVNAFPHAPKFPKNTYQDTISTYDAARSSLGKQVLNKNRSETSVSLKSVDRDTRAKQQLCMTNLDVGPKASMPKFTASMPRLPAETHIMRMGMG